MGYDLSNSAGAYERFTVAGWELALAVAEGYGWQPAGTPPPATWDEASRGRWDNDYFRNEGQEVSPADAASLAAALERAIASADFIERTQRTWDELTAPVIVEFPRDVAPMSREDAEGFRKRLAGLAAFACRGAFVIE